MYYLMLLPLGRRRTVGLATLSVLPLGPNFLIHIMKTEITQLLRGLTRQEQKKGSSCKSEHNSHSSFCNISIRNLTGPGLFLQGAPLPLFADLYDSGFVVCFCSTDTQM